MILLDFRVSPSWRAKQHEAPVASVDDWSLRHDVLLGDLIFKGDGWDFSAKWDWVPLIDVAASFRPIVAELIRRENAQTFYEFTESESTIHFTRDSTIVTIKASYASGEARVSLAELCEAVDTFARHVGDAITKEFPALSKKKVVWDLLSGRALNPKSS